MATLFSKNHIWIKEQDDVIILGITDYAQEKLGTVMFLNLPGVGELVTAGVQFGDVESIKTVSDLTAPVTGEVVEVNEELMDEPDAINDSPYESWFVKIVKSELSGDLMQEEEYEEYCRTL